jgi:predicted TIM-barrel fold metal-dependent hydrolase
VRRPQSSRECGDRRCSESSRLSRGAFYWYFDTLDEAIETLGRRMADEISAETASLFRTQPNPVLRAALGGQMMMRRASMDPVWAGYLSNVHVLLDDSKFVTRVRRNLEAGRTDGEYRFESIKVALDFQVGAILGAVRRCAKESPLSAALVEMNVLVLRGLGVKPSVALELANQAARIVDEVGPEKLPWWRSCADRLCGAEVAMKPNRLDVHAHFIPPGSVPRAAAAQNFMASPMPAWTPEFALDFMDRHDIATQLLSLPMALSKDEARRINEYSATLVKRRPTRFGLLASLPMDDVAASLSEIAFAFDQLDADGVVMVTNYCGDYLGNSKFEPVFAELNRRSATIFIHPIAPAGYECVACGRPGPVIEFPFDTCRSVADMLYPGVLSRHNNIRFILSHAGGALPTLAPRLGTIGTLPWVAHRPELTQETVLAELARLYFDTAIAGTAASLGPVLELTEPDHIVFGTDFPPASEPVIDQNIAALGALTTISEVEKSTINQNARCLFRRFAAEMAGD